ncbi:hypothetical protein [uncultured Lactobacillus sp.]|uniref:hypothetical protein n=1 Tax=uncultured Lactobacillus sp. TaxID=153152 RepID=UPI00258D04A6|nr:hypothetical protein [uncultured Lactobacillus sp.]
MKKTRFFALLTAGIIAVSPVATIFSNQTTTTVLASKKPKKHIAAWKKRPIWEKRKNAYLQANYRIPLRTVHINFSKSKPLYKKVVESVKAWNATGCYTFIFTKKKEANVNIFDTLDGEALLGLTIKPGSYYSTIQLNPLTISEEINSDVDPALSTIEHELGHAIGIKHNNKEESVMSTKDLYLIQPCDVQNVKKLYHEK